MNRKSSFGSQIKGALLLLLFVGGFFFILYQLFQYQSSRRTFPADMTIAGIDVGGLAPAEAGELLRESYLQPVVLYHGEEQIELDPADVGFNLEIEAMVAAAEKAQAEQNYWLGFTYYLTGWTWRPIIVPLQAGYDPALLEEMLVTISGFLDEPAQPPQILSDSGLFEQGSAGFTTDIEASMELVEAALYRPEDRVAHLAIIQQEAPELNFQLLEDVIRGKLATFEGMGSVFIMDLQTGEEININGDLALSGLSILKIPIFVEAYRHLQLPLSDYEEQLFYETAVHSSNYSANLLLNLVAGEPNTYAGTEVLNESMWKLGLANTFMAVPYDATPPDYWQSTYVTPANSDPDLPTQPDPTRQTTAAEMGTLLAMVYHCAYNGGGTLMAVYPGEYTPEECKKLLDLMVLNEEGNLIRFGVPNDVPVSHKHGWIPDTHGDAGIVFSPGGDYVIVEYLHYPGEWLQSDISFPILREISRAVYNYFNFDDPYLGDALTEGERFEEEEEAHHEEQGLPETAPGEATPTAEPTTAADQATGPGMESGQ